MGCLNLRYPRFTRAALYTYRCLHAFDGGSIHSFSFFRVQFGKTYENYKFTYSFDPAIQYLVYPIDIVIHVGKAIFIAALF